MPRAVRHGIEIEYATTGDPEDPALLLINGLGGQLTAWDDDFIDAFVDRGFLVIRFDHREVGLSSRTAPDVDIAAALQAASHGDLRDVPFGLEDMADDAVCVLDDLGIGTAHLFGVSLGGMVAQVVAIRHPDRTASLTAVMSTTGEPHVGQTHPEVLHHLITPGPTEREAAIEHAIRFSRTVGSPDHFEEERVRRRMATAYDRAFEPRGSALQLLAVGAAPDRAAALATLAVPTLVIHGDRDPLIDVSGGRRIAELVPGAELLELEGMGHDLPTYFWPTVIESVTRVAARAAAP